MYGKGEQPSSWSWSPMCHKSAGRGPPSVTSVTSHGPPSITSRMSWSPKCHKSAVVVPQVSDGRGPPSVTSWSLVPQLSTKMTTNILTSNRGPLPIIRQLASGGFHFHRDRIEQTNPETHRLADTVQSTNPLLLFGDESTRVNPRHSKESQVFFSAPPTPIKGLPANKILLSSQCPIIKLQVPIVKSSIPLQPECYSEAASSKKILSNKELQGATKSKSSHIPLQDEERNLLNTIWNTFTNLQSSIQVSTVGCRGPPSVTSRGPPSVTSRMSWSPECLQSSPSTLASNRGY